MRRVDLTIGEPTLQHYCPLDTDPDWNTGLGDWEFGHPTGGGVGAALGIVTAKRIRYLHPAGLEKNVPVDLNEAADMLKDREGKGPTLWVVPGDIFTEIEALRALADVEAVPVGAGGVGGAEGAIWLAVFGDSKSLDKAGEVIESVRGEPAFTES